MVKCNIPDKLIEPEEVKPLAPTRTLLRVRPALGMGHPTLKGARIVITSLEGVISEHALCFEFLVMNNEAEYENLITRLEATKKLGAQDLQIYNDSQLVII